MAHKKRVIGIFGVVFLFFCVVITPNINVTSVKAERYNEIVKVTMQVCDITDDTTYTIQLTKQQVEEVQTIFDNLKNRLSTAESIEETQRTFNDTIIELDSYNLLPEDMSVEQAQRLVNHATNHLHKITPIQKLHAVPADGTIQNSFCSIAGNTSNTHVAKLAKRTALRLYYIIDYNTGNALLVKIATALYVVFNEIGKINQLILRQNGYHFGVCIYFGNYHYTAYPNWLSPAQGWISTNGASGKQNITGSFWGQTMTGGWQPQDDWYMNYTWRGCLGFSGLIIYAGTDSAYYLGSAVSVNVGPSRP